MIDFHRYEMNNERLEPLIRQLGTITDGRPGYWRFNYQGRELFTITDEHFNRMRVMTDIVPESQLNDSVRTILLNANFDRALDAKFATSQGQLWSLFMHPLRELTDSQFIDAVSQVKTLADNFGTSYASSALFFGGKND